MEVTLTFMVDPEFKKRIKVRAIEQGISVKAYLSNLVDKDFESTRLQKAAEKESE